MALADLQCQLQTNEITIVHGRDVCCVQKHTSRCQFVSRLGLMHLIATDVCMWIRVMTVQTGAAGVSETRTYSADDTDNASLLTDVTPGALYSLLHYNVTPPWSLSSPAPAAARIHISGIGLVSHRSTHWNATGELLPSTDSNRKRRAYLFAVRSH